jgi:hypothetical protein
MTLTVAALAAALAVEIKPRLDANKAPIAGFSLRTHPQNTLGLALFLQVTGLSPDAFTRVDGKTFLWLHCDGAGSPAESNVTLAEIPAAPVQTALALVAQPAPSALAN